MRYLILSDIHANWEALAAVLRHVRRKRYDRVLFLGDAVGYGGSPNRVVEWIRTLHPAAITVRGNHDRVCAGLDSPEHFNRYAREASEWTYDQLSPPNLRFLRELPEGPRALDEGAIACHGSTVDEDVYIFSGYDAKLAFDAVPHQLMVFGHTHVPSRFVLGPDGDLEVALLTGARTVIDLEPGHRYLVNPGSVGQPRDRDPRAAYAIYDQTAGRIYQYRVRYKVAEARRRILQAGLPAVLGDRLLYGA